MINIQSIKKYDLLIFLFVANVLVSITSNFTVLGVFHTGLLRVVIALLVFPILIKKIKKSTSSIVIFISLSYFFILIISNTNLLKSFETYVGVVISLLMYPIGYTYFYKVNAVDKLRKLVFGILFIFGVHFLLAQIFQIGSIPYESHGASTYSGGGGVHQTYIIAYLLLFIPLLLFLTKRKLNKFEISAIIMSLLPVLLIFRRGPIVALVGGLILYTLFTYKKGQMIKISLISAFIFTLLFPIYIEQISGTLAMRSIDPTDVEAIEAIGRTQELLLWVPYWMQVKGISHTLFGSELYDYPALAGGGETRSLHTDFSTYIIGSGIVGFILYFSVIGFIWIDFLKSRKHINNILIRRELTAVMIPMIFAYFILSYSGQYYVISALSTVMLFFGYINRVTYDISLFTSK